MFNVEKLQELIKDLPKNMRVVRRDNDWTGIEDIYSPSVQEITNYPYGDNIKKGESEKVFVIG